MGGVIFILAVLISGIIFLGNSLEGIMLVYLSVAFGVIGFIDDYIKVVKKRNLGLTAIQKFALQLVLAVAYILIMYFMNMLETKLEKL